ncbi:TPA: GTPase HflX, partial [bacterium]|nr:GTPase HflX [bacterium]
SDTVGFVSSLPTLLIESFKSTLREILEADLLINVIDFSSDNYERQKEITLKTLESIGAQDIPIIHVYNKIDLASNNIFRTEDDSVYMSATNREGMDKLISMIKEKLFGSYRICTMFIPYNESHVFGQLSNNAKIFSKIEQEKGIEVRVRCSKIDYERFKKYLVGGNDNE